MIKKKKVGSKWEWSENVKTKIVFQPFIFETKWNQLVLLDDREIS